MKKILTFLMLALLTITASAEKKQFWLCGSTPIGDGVWTRDHLVAMTYDSETGISTADITVGNVTWFTIADGKGDSDDDFKASHRFACGSDDF